MSFIAVPVRIMRVGIIVCRQGLYLEPFNAVEVGPVVTYTAKNVDSSLEAATTVLLPSKGHARSLSPRLGLDIVQFDSCLNLMHDCHST